MTNEIHNHRRSLEEHGLQDGCPACADIAKNPIAELDDAMLGQLATLATSADRLSRGRSENELVAAANVLTLLEQVGRLAEAAPSVVAWYLREKWRLDAQIDNPRAEQLADFARKLEAGEVGEPAPTGTEEPTPEPDDGLTAESREWLGSDPVCRCEHRLSEHDLVIGVALHEQNGACHASVPVPGASAAQGEDVYAECECSGFVSADLESAPEPN